MDNIIQGLEDKATTYQSKLDASPTAYTNKVAPTKYDMGQASKLKKINAQIDTLRSTQLRNTWYGPTTKAVPTEDSASSDGLFMKGLKFLQKPLNMIAGTAQYAMGDGTSKDYFENLDTAMKSGLTFGNLMEKKGAPSIVSMPVGFALDVMLDPVNWLTGGSSTLVGAGVKGLVKGAGREGALKAAGLGIASNLERKAAKTLAVVPFVKKIAEGGRTVEEMIAAGKAVPEIGALRSGIVKGSMAFDDLANRVSGAALKSASAYDKAIGETALDRFGKGILGLKKGAIGDFAASNIKKLPYGEPILDAFTYSTRKSVEVAKKVDEVKKLAGERNIFLTGEKAGYQFKTMSDYLKPGAEIQKLAEDGTKLVDAVSKQPIMVAIRDADGALLEEFKNTRFTMQHSYDNALAILDMAGKEKDLKLIAEGFKIIPKGRTGVEWYDTILNKMENATVDDLLHWRLGSPIMKAETIATDADKVKAVGQVVRDWNSVQAKMAGVKDWKPLEALLIAHRNFTNVFKFAKVPMNPGSFTVAHLGNTIMAKMLGLPVENPEFMASFFRANRMARGRLSAKMLKETFLNDTNSMFDLMHSNPTLFKKVFGENASEIMDMIYPKGASAIDSAKTVEDMNVALSSAWDEMDAGLAQAESLDDIEKAKKLARTPEEIKRLSFSTASQTAQEDIAQGLGTLANAPSSVMSEIESVDKIEAVRTYLSKMAEERPGNVGVRLANLMVNSMPKWFEQVDQTWKIATMDYVTRIGLTEAELNMISRTVNISKGDIVAEVVKDSKGRNLPQKLYKIDPTKATEIALEAFMDYSAMPDAVRVLRAIPIVGSPFYSFPYAMAIKTAKTAVNNPAVFNKVGFMMNEISGLRSPEEKKALEQQYNQYLNSPTVVKLFGQWNTDVKNWIPYYTMNMFNPSERKYDDSFQGKMLEMSDKFPVLQDPVGSIIKDFFIQPWILSGSGQVPQGSFGQPLYPSFDAKGNPIEASAGTKAFYGARTLAESVVPGSVGLFGPLLSGLPPEIINMIPSYGARSTAYAAQGRSSIGAMTKEDAVRKTLRSILSKVGLPAYTLDTNKLK